jgi:ABC-type Na+ efflux pump permease subunit
MHKRRPIAVLLNVVVIFAMCLFLLYCGADSLGGDNPFAFIGAFMVIPLSLGLAWLQYRSAVCCKAGETRVLAVVFFVLAGFFFFAAVSNLLESLFKTPPPDRTTVGPVGLAIIVAILAILTAYFVMSGLINWKWSKVLQTPADADAGKEVS